MEEIRILAPTGALGYTPFNEESFYAGLEQNPDIIGADAGSPDSGPVYVATPTHYGTRLATKHDIRLLLQAAIERHIPLIIGGAGGFGSKQDVAWTLDIINEIAREEKLSFDMAVVYSDVEREFLKNRLKSETIEGLGIERPLTVEDIDRSQVICAQMGPEPLAEALKTGAQVIIAGRSCDDAIFSALPFSKGYDHGLSMHMGKIIECGGASAEPHSLANSIVGVLRKDHFLIRGTAGFQRVSVDSVAEHTLYERDHPYIQPGPGGVNDLKRSVYTQIDDSTVKVSGSRWISGSYKVRLEGAAKIGYRTIGIAGIRCPRLLQQLDDFLEEAKAAALRTYHNQYDPSSYHIIFRVYGRDGVMGALEPDRQIAGKEICLITEVIGDTQEISTEICAFLEHSMLFQPYPGIISTAGNLAHLNSVEVHPTEGAFQFTIDHLLPLEDPTEIACIEMHRIGTKGVRS